IPAPGQYPTFLSPEWWLLLRKGVFLYFRSLITTEEDRQKSDMSAASVCRVSKRAQEKRYMVVLLGIFYLKDNGHIRIKTGRLAALQVRPDFECQPVNTRINLSFFGKQVRNSSVGIC